MSKNINDDDGTKSIILSLETLSKEYDTVLIKYNQAQTDYINYLKIQSEQSANNVCSKYKSDSKEIDQACYDEVWKKAGCTTTGVVNANSNWAKKQTLNGLIDDSFAWATMTDSNHRNSCYGTTNKDFTTAISPNYNINSEPLISIKGQKFEGTKLRESAATSVEQCMAMCSADSSCTGATYNLDKAYCLTVTGEGSINDGTPNDYAIVPENLKHLKIIQKLSEKLTNINQEILKTINAGEPLYGVQNVQRKKQTVILNENYNKLTQEREKVENSIKKYQDLDKSQNETNIFINQKYLIYIMLIIIILIIVFLFITFLSSSSTPTSPSSSSTFEQSNNLNKSTYIVIFIIFLITFIIWKKYSL
jgi:hypothetical protein